MFPHNLNTRLVYSPVVESYGVTSRREYSAAPKKSIPKKPESSTGKKSVPKKPESPAKKNISVVQKKSKMVLTDLPSEMLEKIFKMLDSFRQGLIHK